MNPIARILLGIAAYLLALTLAFIWFGWEVVLILALYTIANNLMDFD